MPDQHELEALLRATRPVPEPAWAARLDRRVADGFPHGVAWWRRPLTLMRANLLPLGAVASVLLIVVMAAALSDGGRDGSGSAGSRTAAGSKAAPEGATSDSAAGGRAPAPAVPRDARAVRRSASLTLSTSPAGVEDVADRAIRVADSLGGFVQSSSVDSDGGQASASLLLDVPQERLQDALGRLSRLGHVRARSQEAEDVTDTRSALRALVRDARAERAGLRRRLAAATSETEAARLRARLQRVEHLITVRERRVAALNRDVALATIAVSVQGDRHAAGAAHPGGRWTPGDALHDAGRVLEVAAGVALIALALAIPLGIVGGLAVLAGRILRRRRRERALELA